MTFREYLYDDIFITEPVGHNLLNPLLEGIIDPGKIKLKSLDIEYLRQKYPDIIWKQGKTLSGGYNGDKKKIFIQIPDNENIHAVEAMIGHELIHYFQDEKSKGKMFDKTVKDIEELNNLSILYNKDKNKKIFDKYQELLQKFQFNNSFEKMAYAYQMVKDRERLRINNPDDIIKYYRNVFEIEPDIRLKKYIAMYWLIKDNI